MPNLITLYLYICYTETGFSVILISELILEKQKTSSGFI